MVAPLAATTSQPPKAFSLEKKQRTDPKQDRHVASRVVGYAAEVLGLDPQPQLYVKGDNVEPIQVANTTDSGRLSPSVVLGRPMRAYVLRPAKPERTAGRPLESGRAAADA